MRQLILKTALLACAAIAGNAHAVAVAGQGTWETRLLGRDINGNAVAGNADSAVFLYDTVLDVTWLRDANYAQTSGYYSLYSDGRMNWVAVNTWAANLVVGAYDDWRLPTLQPVNGTSFNYDQTFDGTSDRGYAATGTGWGTASEMGHLFYVTLGNTQAPFSDTALSNTGDFQNLQSSAYWSGLVYATSPSNVWTFNPGDGRQGRNSKNDLLRAMAVRPGDVLVSPIPEPETYALMLAGLGLVGFMARRRKAK
jgi:hypothetical protein